MESMKKAVAAMFGGKDEVPVTTLAEEMVGDGEAGRKWNEGFAASRNNASLDEILLLDRDENRLSKESEAGGNNAPDESKPGVASPDSPVSDSPRYSADVVLLNPEQCLVGADGVVVSK